MITLYDHQKKAVNLLKENDNFALLMSMGTGKSACIVTDWIETQDTNLLLIAPKSVYRNWYGEIDKVLTEEQKKFVFITHWVSGGGNKKDQANISRVLKPWPNIRRVFLMNVEAFSSTKNAIKCAEKFLESGKGIIVIDESTRIKTGSSNRTKAIVSLGEKAWRKRILSGLPTPRSPMDLFSQFYFLDWRILGFRNFYSFRSRYAVLKKMVFGGRSVDTIVSYQNLDELQAKVAKASFRVLKEECLDLPPKIYTERSVDLSDEQRRLYEELRKNATSQLNDEFVTSTTAISLLQRLHQITYGHVRNDLGEIVDVDASPREQALMEVLEECDGKVIIWANFRATIKRIRKLIIDEYGEESLVEYWGETSSDLRETAKSRFQQDPTCRFFLGNPSTGGIGITLTAAKYMCYYSNSFDLEHRLQSEDRAHRAGLQHPVTYIDLVARGTIDEKILKALRAKIDLASLITGESAKEWIR